MGDQRILVVDDEPTIRRSLATNLAARGYEVLAVATGEEALAQIAAHRPDLVILDLLLPGVSGLEVCRDVRLHSAIPILVLSGHDEQQVKVHALDLGADDYLTKPFGIEELLARVRALLRRRTGAPDGAAPSAGTPALAVGGIAVQPDTYEAWLDGRPLDLTRRECEVLVFLLRHAGWVVPSRSLLAEVWGSAYTGEAQYLRVFINRLRHKIEEDPSHPRIILTEQGVGYRLVPRPPAVASADADDAG